MNNANALIQQCRKAAAYADPTTTAALHAEIGALQATIRALVAAETPTTRDLQGGTLYTINVNDTEIQVSADVTGGSDWDGQDQDYVHIELHGFWIKGAPVDGVFFEAFYSDIEEQIEELYRAGAAADCAAFREAA